MPKPRPKAKTGIVEEEKVKRYFAKRIFPKKRGADSIREAQIKNVANALGIPYKQVWAVYAREGWKPPAKQEQIALYLKQIGQGGGVRGIAPNPKEVETALKWQGVTKQDVWDFYRTHEIKYEKATSARTKKELFVKELEKTLKSIFPRKTARYYKGIIGGIGYKCRFTQPEITCLKLAFDGLGKELIAARLGIDEDEVLQIISEKTPILINAIKSEYKK